MILRISGAWPADVGYKSGRGRRCGFPFGGRPVPLGGGPLPLGGKLLPFEGGPLPLGGKPVPFGGGLLPLGGKPLGGFPERRGTGLAPSRI
jgi:hypothetical protein